MKCDLKYPVATSCKKKKWQLMWNRRRPWNGAWLRETCSAFDKLQECENKILIPTFYSKNNKVYHQFGLLHKGELWHSNHLVLLGLRHLWAYIILTKWRHDGDVEYVHYILQFTHSNPSIPSINQYMYRQPLCSTQCHAIEKYGGAEV